jgi:RecB family exonuclease
MLWGMREIKAEPRRRMHEPIASVGEWLHKVVMGYYRYHAVPGNLDRLRVFGNVCAACGGWYLAVAVSAACCRGIG